MTPTISIPGKDPRQLVRDPEGLNTGPPADLLGAQLLTPVSLFFTRSHAAPPAVDAILVGDLFYEKGLAERLLAWLEQARLQGCAVLIGDPGRSYLPRERLVECASYQVPVTRDLEDAEIKRTSVWQLA